MSEYPVSEGQTIEGQTIEATFGPRRECDFGGNGGGGPGGVLRTGRWFGPRDPGVVADGPSACRHVATYVTRTNRVAILSIPSEVCRACLVENAVEGSLANFFGDVGASDEEEEEKEEEDDDETLGAPGVAWDVDESPSDASERARRADALDPANTFFVETGLTDALLHVTMGSHPLSHRVQIAALGAIRAVASENRFGKPFRLPKARPLSSRRKVRCLALAHGGGGWGAGRWWIRPGLGGRLCGEYRRGRTDARVSPCGSAPCLSTICQPRDLHTGPT